MARKVLLLNNNCEVLAFVLERRALKLYLKGKAEAMSHWDDHFTYLGQKIPFPAVLRLRHLVKRPNRPLAFSRRSVIKRDLGTCQYCGKVLDASSITIDHVIPRVRGGRSDFHNCVVACYPCNNRKGHQTLEEAEMTLLRKPFIPTMKMMHIIDRQPDWHQDWHFYIKKY